MSDKLVFYTHPWSRGRMIRWMLEEVGQPYETRVLEYGTEMKAPDYLAINPMGKVPTVTHGDTVVTECAAICAYLADAFPQVELAPAPADRARGTYYRWMFFAAGPLEAATSNKMMGFVVPPERKMSMGYGSLDDVLAVLERAVESREFIAGDRFSAADVYVGSHIGWGMQFGSIEKRPAFERYYCRLADRPAFIRAKALDDALKPMPGG